MGSRRPAGGDLNSWQNIGSSVWTYGGTTVTAFSKQNLAMLGLAGSGEQPINPDRGRIGKGRRIGKARMTAKDIIAQDIIAQELTVFDITGDGSRFRMSFR